MFQNLQSILSFSLSLSEVLINLFIAFFCGLVVSLFYKWTYRGPNYSSTFVNALIILAMITSVVIMVIGNNLARAFGLVGAMSIIRFRTAVKDTQDIVFIFFALAIGMASGVGLHSIAIVGTLFIGTVLWVLSRLQYANPRKQEFILQFTSTTAEDEQSDYLNVFKKYCKTQKLVNLRSFGEGDQFEYTFYVKLKKQEESEAFIREMNRLPDIERVNLFFDEEQF